MDNETTVVQFEHFPRLPKEIRLKIWEHAAQEPRIVEIWQKPHAEPRPDRNETESIENESNEDESSDEDSNDEEEPSSTSPSNSDSPQPPTLNPAQSNGFKTESESDDDEEPINPNPFTSPTPIPAILHATSESRSIALKHYIPPFPSSPEQPTIFYNAAVDILYFPPWCFQHGISQFERWISDEAKGKIRKIAIENLVWYSYVDDGSINDQIQISEFKGLEEFYLVSRNPDHSGCGCCHEFEHPDSGVLGFEVDPGKPVRDMGDGDGDEEKRRLGKNMRTFRDKVRDGVDEQFGKIREKDLEWRTPELRFMKVMRDGVAI